jgi:hypothetical protein
MSDDWIKYRVGLPTNPRVIKIAGILRKPIPHIVGSLMAFWAIGDKHTTDGVLDGYTPDVVDDMIGLRGFAEALRTVGWLEVGDGSVTIPDFDEHNSQSAKRRASKAKDMERYRCRSVDNARPQNDHKLTTERPPEKEEEKEQSKKKTKTGAAPPLGVFPDVLDTPEFRAAWAEYEANRREIGYAKLTPRGQSKKFKDFVEWGHDAAIQSINESIANGWTGLFRPARVQPAKPSNGPDKFGCYDPTNFPEKTDDEVCAFLKELYPDTFVRQPLPGELADAVR